MLRKLLSQTQIYNHSLPKKGLIYDKQFATYAVMKSFLDGDVKKGELLKVPMSKENSLEYVFYYIHNTLQRLHFPDPQLFGAPAFQKQYGYVQLPTYTIGPTHHAEIDATKTPDQIVLLALNVEDDSCKLILNYDDHRRKHRDWFFNIKESDFWIFPSDMTYRITRNKSDKINHYILYQYDELY